MAQRGGAMVCHVRIGENVHAPTFAEGMADVIVGLEPLEALRNIRFASSQTLVLLSTEAIVPSIVSVGSFSYPSWEDIVKRIRSFTEHIVSVDATDLARKAGNVITQNTVMLGALAATHRLPMRLETIKSATRELAPPKYMDINVRALELGYDALESLISERSE